MRWGGCQSANILTHVVRCAISLDIPSKLAPTERRGSVRYEGVSMDRQTLSIMKACEEVGVSRRTIYNWIAAGKVEYVRTAGGSIRIFADSLWRNSSERRDQDDQAPSRA